MRTITAVSALALSIAASPLQAADIYAGGGLKDSPIVVETPSWTRFYVGVGVQGDSVFHDLTLSEEGTDLATLKSIGGQGAGFVATIGGDWQLPGSRFVVGLNFDYDFASAESSLGIIGTTGASYTLTDYWTVTGRLGFLFTPSTLVYAKGGFGEATFHPGGFLTMPGINIGDHTFTGPVVGGGIETRLDSFCANCTVRLEYTDFIADSATWNIEPEGFVALRDDMNIQSVKLIFAYGFGGGYVPLK